MPHYYFHCDGDDTEGLELPDDAAAWREGRAALDEMIEQATVRPNSLMEVVEEGGRRVAMFSPNSEWSRPSAGP